MNTHWIQDVFVITQAQGLERKTIPIQQRELTTTERFHSRVKHPCKFMGTKESANKRYRSTSTSQHGRRVMCFFENEYGYRDVISLQKRSIALYALALLDIYGVGFDLTIHGHVWLGVSCPLTQHTISYSCEPSYSSTVVPTHHHRKNALHPSRL